MENKLKTLLFYMLLAQLLNAKNELLLNKGIVDIGRTSTYLEVEVAKEKIFRDPDITIVPGSIVYADRLQSEKMDCMKDYIGTEICQESQEDCISSEVFNNGYSVLHHVTKDYEKYCGSDQIREDDRCYYDGNYNGIKEFPEIIYDYKTYEEREPIYSTFIGVWYRFPIIAEIITYLASHSGSVSTNIQNISNTVGNGPNKLAAASTTYWTEQDRKDRPWIKLANGYLCADGSLAVSTELGSLCLERPCEEGYIKDYVGYCYKPLHCPSLTTEQEDGSCKMEYDYYTYHCPDDGGEYELKWNIINSGEDCGNPSCTNSSIPPSNNCVRNDYTCPIDASQKCGKLKVGEKECGDGYIWNDNRCERIESYCGASYYNASQDVCQNILLYTKLCRNSSDIYNPTLDICSSVKKACINGIYNKEKNICESNFVGSCSSPGYKYIEETQSCIADDIELCSNPHFTYDAVYKKCIRATKVCGEGLEYDESRKKCIENICTILSTTRNGDRCETSSICDGVVTPDGKCIPSKIRE